MKSLSPERTPLILRVTLTILLFGLTLATAEIGSANDFGKIVVMPVEAADKSLAEGAAVMEEIISEHFNGNRSVMIISTEQKEALSGSATGNRLHIIRTIASKMDSNQALIFSLTRYRERVGDKYSVEEPASLAFEFKLLNAADGRVACSGRFDETQQALTENILDLPLALKRGFKWLTVKEMASEAVRAKFNSCPALLMPKSSQ